MSVNEKTETNKKFDAAYHRRRRAELKTGAHKKRDERFARIYERTLASLLETTQIAAMLLLEHPEPKRLQGALTPLPVNKDGFIEHELQPTNKQPTNKKLLLELDKRGLPKVDASCVESLPRLSLTPYATARRREARSPERLDPAFVQAMETQGVTIVQVVGKSYCEAHHEARKHRERKKNRRYAKAHPEIKLANNRKTRARLIERRLNAPFVAIDAEGCNIGEPFEIARGEDASRLGIDERAKAQDHRTFLWGACDANGKADWLGGRDKTPLKKCEIVEWLLQLPKKFPDAIFVMFAAGYDWTQIFRDMPYQKAWELQKGLPWSEHDAPTGMKPNRRREVLWGDYMLRLYPGKKLEIGKFRDPDNTRNVKGEFDLSAKIVIFDTFGFF